MDAASFVQEYFVEVLVGLVIAVAAWFRTQIWTAAKLLFTSIQRIRQAQRAIRDDRPWLIKEPRRRDKIKQSKIPIITIANLKGGVGKTTITSNLAAYFALETNAPGTARKRRVLVIDLDFQGSASSMLLKREDRIPSTGQLSDASQLLLGELKEREIVRALKAETPPERVHVIPAYYDLARTETRVQLQWMIGDEKDDVRYRLADALNAEGVQERYDLILIDAPPRLTTACIAALGASTHLLVPTILDILSGEAVGSFIDQIEQLRELWPHLKFMGVVGTMVAENPTLGGPLKKAEADGVIAVTGALEQVYQRYNLTPPQDAMFPRDTYIVDSQLIRQRSDTVSFAELGNDQRAVAVKDMFRRLGAQIEERLE